MNLILEEKSLKYNKSVQESDLNLEPRRKKITAMLSRQGAMLEELRAVLIDINPETARLDLRRLILEENALDRGSLSSRREVLRKLRERYFREESPRATTRFIQAIQASSDTLQTGLLTYLMFTWNDALAFKLGVEWLAPKLQSGPFVADTNDITRELEVLESKLSPILNWGGATRVRIGRHYLGLLRDCGFAEGATRKSLRRPYISPDVILFATELIMGSGEQVDRMPEHNLYTTMGLNMSEVVDALYELDRQGRVDFAVQGGIVHLELHHIREGL